MHHAIRRAARDGANIAIAAKTAEVHPTLPGTIYSAAEDVLKAGGQALPLIVDVRGMWALLPCVLMEFAFTSTNHR